MSSWICDGVPKDGKKYPGKGGAHEPTESYSPDCEICELPRGSHKKSKGEKILSQKYILGAAALGIIFLTGGIIARFSGVFSEGRHLKAYEEARARGEEALSIIQTHRNPEELAEAQEYLSLALANLSKIPQKASIYPDVEATMSDYDTLSVQIANKLKQSELSGEYQICAEEPIPNYCIWKNKTN